MAASAAAKLVIDAPGLVPLGADDVQAAPLADRLRLFEDGRVAAQDDVDAAASHVGRDRHRPRPTGLGDDHAFAFVILGVQNLVRHSGLGEKCRDDLVFLDGSGADENRLAVFLARLDVFGDRPPLRL